MHASFTAEEHYRRGRDLFDCGKQDDALASFRTAYNLDRANPRYRSFFGLGLALVERRFDRALELCRSGAKEEFFNPELYHNLARVHLAFGFKAEAIRYLRRGLMIDPGNAPMIQDLSGLGLRERPEPRLGLLFEPMLPDVPNDFVHRGNRVRGQEPVAHGNV